MKILFSVVILLCFGLVQPGIAGNAGIPRIINFNKALYGGANKNWSIAFDHEGYTYFGNSIGLIEFDGVSWHLYPSPNGFVVRAIAVDPDNRIYTGGYRELGYWERNPKGHLEYHSLTNMVEKHFPRNEEFWHIFIIEKKVYFQSFSGIYIYENETFRIIRIDGFITNASVVKNHLLIALQDKGIYKVSGNNYTPFLQSDFFKGKTITFIARPGSDEYLLGTETEGMFSFNMNTGDVHPWSPRLTNSFIRNNINNGIVTKHNKIILGTILGGLQIIDMQGNLEQNINIKSGLQSNTVHSLISDSQGNIWVASDKGLDFISFSSPGSYTVYRHEELGAVYSAALYHGFLYTGTNQGLFKRKWDQQNRSFSLIQGTQRQVWDCKIIDDKIFVGHNSGTFLVNNQQTEMISNHSGGYAITTIPHHPDRLLQCTYSDLIIFSKENGRWRAKNTVKGFSDLIKFVEFDHRNNLWASHLYHGVYRIRLNEELDSAREVTYYDKESPMWRQGKSIRVFKIENRIVFTNEDKLYTYNDLNDSVVPYHFLNEHLGKYATSFRISKAPKHLYWFINSEGIALFRFSGTDVAKIKEFPVALFSNDLIPKEENIIPLDEKKALLCLENGYAVLDAETSEEGNRITRESLHLREVAISDQSGTSTSLSPYRNRIIIPFTQNNLMLRYSFPLYSGETIKYQYKIEGLANEWSAPEDSPRFLINRIPQGEYTIKVRAVNNWKKTSQIHELNVRVKPPWYQSTVAIIVYSFIFLALFFLGKHITIKRVKLNEKHKRDEKERELIRLRNEKLQSELSFKSRELANSAMSIIKKNEFLFSLKEKLKRQKKQLDVRYPDKYYNELINKIDGNISGEDDWNVFEHNFNLAHETFFRRLKNEYPKLTPSDLRLCAFLRINLTSKEIAPLLGISVRGVENHRYRVRKKLNLPADTDLTEFILSFPGNQDQPGS
jgi:DNA-binding CsgD family transcriptional regulator